MAKTSNINIRIDPDVKEQAEQLFGNFGITITDAVNIFIHQSLLTGSIPFEIKMPNKETLEALEDVKKHRNMAGPFESVSALMEDLNNDAEN